MDKDTYLDPELMLSRLRTMEQQSDQVKNTIDSTNNIMEDLKQSFEGFSSAELQKEYADVAETYDDFRRYLQEKIKDMEELTGNIVTTDEG